MRIFVFVAVVVCSLLVAEDKIVEEVRVGKPEEIPSSFQKVEVSIVAKCVQYSETYGYYTGLYYIYVPKSGTYYLNCKLPKVRQAVKKSIPNAVILEIDSELGLFDSLSKKERFDVTEFKELIKDHPGKIEVKDEFAVPFKATVSVIVPKN